MAASRGSVGPATLKEICGLIAAVPQPAAPVGVAVVAPPVDVHEVLAAVETLYKDELKPCGRILRKRLSERAVAAGLGAVDVCIKRLRPVCEACPWLCVQVEEGGDWSALIRGVPAHFVDVYCPIDIYPPEMWHEAEGYFTSLDDSKMVLPGGRYSCAQALVQRTLPFLKDRSLGQVCHIVQLAISQKKILGYLNGAVVPYTRSQSMVKEKCAEKQRPCSGAARGTNMLATWELLRSCLKEILNDVTTASGSIPLSNVKRIFRSRFHVELSETALGHAKLSELLQDTRLRDTCSVRLRCHGYVVVPSDQHAALAPAAAHAQENSRELPVIPGPVVTQGAKPEPRPELEPHSADAKAAPRAKTGGENSSLRERAMRRGVKPMDLEDDVAAPQAPAWVLPPSTPPTSVRLSPGSVAQHRWRSVPPPRTPLSTPPMTPPAQGTVFRPLLTPSTLGSYGFGIQNTFIHATVPPPTPVAGAERRSQSLPRSMFSCVGGRPGSISPIECGPRSPLRCASGVSGGPVLLGRWYPKEQDGMPIKKERLQAPEATKGGRVGDQGSGVAPSGPTAGEAASDEEAVRQRVVRLADFI